jgi:hypothetical protein
MLVHCFEVFEFKFAFEFNCLECFIIENSVSLLSFPFQPCWPVFCFGPSPGNPLRPPHLSAWLSPQPLKPAQLAHVRSPAANLLGPTSQLASAAFSPMQPTRTRHRPLSLTRGARVSSPSSSRPRAGLHVAARICLTHDLPRMARTPMRCPGPYLSRCCHLEPLPKTLAATEQPRRAVITLAERRRRRPAASLPQRRREAVWELRKVECKPLVPRVCVADLYSTRTTSPEFHHRRLPRP